MKPIIQVWLNGQDISSRMNGRILKGQIVENDGGRADELAITLSNFDGMLAKPQKGATLDVRLGFTETGVGKVGTFKVQEVTKIGVAAAFEVKAQSADFKKTLKQQKTRSWVKKTLGDALRQIASDNGLQAAIDPELAALKGNFYQTGVSDIHFVTEQATKYGAIGKVAQGKLVFVKKGEGTSASGAAMGSITITPNDLEGDFRIADRDRPNRGKVKAIHHDRDKNKREEITEGTGDGPEYVFPQIFGSKEEAQKAVKGRKREFDRSEKSFSGVLMTGRNDAKAGGKLTTQGFGDDDDHEWTLQRVVHEFDDNGYVTKFEAKVNPKSKGKGKGAGKK